MAESIADLSIALRATADKLSADINRGIDQAQSGVSVRAMALGTAIGVSVVAGMAVAMRGMKAAVGAAFEGLNRIDAMDEMATKTGLAYNAMVDLSYAAKATGSSAEAMSSSIIKMQQNIANGNAKEAFSRMGLDFAAIKKLAPEKQFAEVANALSQIKNNGTKLELTKEIMGKGGTQIMNVINMGKGGLAEVTRLVQSLGGHLTDVQVIMAGMANDRLDQLSAQFGFLKDQIAVGLAPALITAVKHLQAFVSTYNQEGGGIAGKIQEWAAKAVDFAADIATVYQIGEVLFAAWNTQRLFFWNMAKQGIESVKIAIEGAKAAWDLASEAWTQGSALVGNAFKKMFYEFEVGAIMILNKFPTILGWIDKMKKALELIPAAVTAIKREFTSLESSMASGLGSTLGKLMPTASKVGSGVKKYAGAAKSGWSQFLNPAADWAEPQLPGANASAPSADLLLPFPDQPIYDPVDMTKLTEGLLDAPKKAGEAFRMMGVNAAKGAGEVQAAFKDTTDKLDALAAGDTYGDGLRKKVQETVTAANEIGTAQANSTKQFREVADAEDKADSARRKRLMGQQLDDLGRIDQANIQTYDSFREIGQRTIGDLVTSWATGTGRISDIVSQWANNMIQQFIQVSLFGNKAGGGSMSGLLSKASGMGTGAGGGGSGWMGVVGSVLGGFFADGGRPPMGKVSVVGERGPELFVPDSAGQIVPNNRAKSFMGSGGGNSPPPIVIPITQNFSTGVTHADLAGAMDQVQDAARAGVIEATQRGGSFRKVLQS